MLKSQKQQNIDQKSNISKHLIQNITKILKKNAKSSVTQSNPNYKNKKKIKITNTLIKHAKYPIFRLKYISYSYILPKSTALTMIILQY